MTNARTARTTRDKAAELRAAAARAQARRRSALALGMVTLVIAIIVGTFVLVQNSKSSATQDAATPANLGTTNSIVVGKASAPVTLVAYEDFQCPACRQFEQLNQAQITTWIADGTVRVEYRPIAFLNRMSTTDYSTRALNVAAAIVNSDPSAFPAFHQLLYANQPEEGSAGLTDDQLTAYAVQAGAPKAAITSAVQNHTYDDWAAQVTDAASKAGVNQTPTLMVNGTKISSYDPAVVKKAVEAAAK